MTDKDTVICIYNDNGMPIEEFILKIFREYIESSMKNYKN